MNRKSKKSIKNEIFCRIIQGKALKIVTKNKILR